MAFQQQKVADSRETFSGRARGVGICSCKGTKVVASLRKTFKLGSAGTVMQLILYHSRETIFPYLQKRVNHHTHTVAAHLVLDSTKARHYF